MKPPITVLAVSLASMLAGACGPGVDQGEESLASGEGTGEGGAIDGNASATAMLEGDESEGSSSSEPSPKYDLTPFPDPVGACAPMPPECGATWAEAEEILDPLDAGGTQQGGLIDVRMFPSPGTPPPLNLWGLRFEMPCPTMPQGPPEIPSERRFEVDGLMNILRDAGWEYTQVGTYPVLVDVEYLNACMHLRIHGVTVQPLPPDSETPPFEWPELLPSGYVWVNVFDE